MAPTEAKELIGSVEHLLWVIARCDVESLAGQRGTALRKLRELEERAHALQIADLYEEVLHHCKFQ